MKTLFYVIFLGLMNRAFSHTPFQDSLLKTLDHVVFDSDYRGFGYALQFKPNGIKQTHQNEHWLDTLAKAALFYEECICEIKLNEYNKETDVINRKRIQTVLHELSQRIDTSKINYRIYWQSENNHDFDAIFGPDNAYIEMAQHSVGVSINCENSFHLKGVSKPYSGYHVWTEGSGKITSITGYLNGKKHGKAYTWYYGGQLAIMEFEKDILIKRVLFSKP